MRLLVLSFVATFVVAACATATNTGDDVPGADGGGGGKDATTLGDAAKTDGGSGGIDTGPGCDKCGGATCLDLKTDKMNCGTCGNACSDVCCNGVCIDTTNDSANCGSCGMACTGGNTCCSSACVDTKSDKSNCGACGSTCNGTCTNGKCMMQCTVDLGSCAHSPCVSGVALTDMCDNDGCTYLICDFIDSTCCSSTWDSTCVQEAIFWCSLNCSGC